MRQLQTPFFKINEKDLLYDITLLRESLEENWATLLWAILSRPIPCLGFFLI